MTNFNKTTIALSIGDPGGIGPEICLKAAITNLTLNICNAVIIGDIYVLKTQAKLCNLSVDMNVYNTIDEIDWELNSIPIINLGIFSDKTYRISEVNAINGKAALDFASKALSLGANGKVDAVVAAPHTQSSIAKAGIVFDGYPSFVAKEAGISADDVVLMLCFDNYRIAHCTLHVSIKSALQLITTKTVINTIKTVNNALRSMGIKSPKMVISGINPHAGENGLFGSEDVEILIPAVEISRSEGINVSGPVGADIMFHLDNIDAFIVMLHDQGHIPAKLLARHRTIALSIGGPVLFSSVAHGSAHDIAGKGVANPSAIIEAMKMLSVKY